MIVSFSDIPAPGLQPISVELSPDGKMTLHHNVQVYALGKTARGLEQEIRSEYVPKSYKYLTVTIKTEMRFLPRERGSEAAGNVYLARGNERLCERSARRVDSTIGPRKRKCN